MEYKKIAKIFAKTLIQEILERTHDQKSQIFGRAINFVKYHNAFTIILVLAIIATGSVMASEPGRDMLAEVVGEEVVVETGIDNTALLQANLSTFDLAMTIDAVSEDENNYYVDFSFNTLGIIDNVWQELFRKETMKVSKLGLEEKDLGLHLTEELGEIADNAIVFLREMQTKEMEKGKTEIVETSDYTGLIGLVLDVKNKVLPDYEPVIPEPKPEICDGLDNDLDGEIDEDLAVYSGSNTGQCQQAIIDCINGEMIQVQTEISRNDEVCGDGIDNNCNGEIDENCCVPSAEICNNLDDDCDGLVDEDLGQIVCGIGACRTTINRCQNGYLEICIPIAPTSEICDGLDNDCDGEVDEGDVCNVPSEPLVLPEPVCDLEHLSLCLTESDCFSASGFWYDGACNAAAEQSADVCDTDHIDLCDTQEKCEEVGLYWYGSEEEICNSEPEPEPVSEPVCDLEHITLCDTQEKCEGISLFWYNEICNLEQEIIDCVPDWSCSDWSPAPETIACGQEFSQTRTCEDLNSCGIDDGKPAEEQIATGTDVSACPASSCDAALNLVGECANTCVEQACSNCVPTCVCADGFFDCDNDLGSYATNGCETQGVCE